jgi:hypothetical protein
MQTDPNPNEPFPTRAPRPWERQPGESGRDYLDFLAWLECPRRHPLSEAAARLDLPVSRFRSLSARHRWRWRAAAYDDHRCQAAQEALKLALQRQSRTLQERVEHFRDQEWALHELMLEMGLQAMRSWKVSRRRLPRLGELARVLFLASTLGRRACGMADSEPMMSPQELQWKSELEAAIRKVYGEQAMERPSVPPSTPNPQPTAP